MKKKILILDESGIFIRNCLGGGKDLCTHDGQYTGGIFGFVNTVINIVERINPDHIISAVDSSRRTLKRKEMFPAYKENRENKPNPIRDYQWQKASIKRFSEITGIEMIRKEGYEADDVVASIATQYGDKYEIYILSSDKDFVQLVTNNVKIIRLGFYGNAKDFEIVDNLEEAGNVLGVPADCAVDDQSLQGDAADNYPGCLGVGKVSAMKMINKFKTIEGIYENLNDDMFFTKKGEANALRKNLTRDLTEVEVKKWGFDKLNIKTNKEAIFLSRELAELDVNLDLGLELINFKEILDQDKLLEFYEELEFNSLI